MTPKRIRTERRSALASLFLDDPWRKLLAIVLGLFFWIYISNLIVTSKERVYRLTTINTSRPGRNLFIQEPDGFKLWSVNKDLFDFNPTITIKFTGPEQIMNAVPSNLSLSIDPERLAKINAEVKSLEITKEDITVPDFPQFESLLKDKNALTTITKNGVTKTSLFLLFEKISQNEEHHLGITECLITDKENLPAGFDLGPNKNIWFQPSRIQLTGPERVVSNVLKYSGKPNRERLLENLAIRPTLPVFQDATGKYEIVLPLTLGPSWTGLTMTPSKVEIHIPLIRKPKVTEALVPLAIDLIGEGADQWKVMDGDSRTRNVQVKVFDPSYWWEQVNNVDGSKLKREPNPKAQIAWVKDNIRLFVTFRDSEATSQGPTKELEIRHHILAPKGEDKPDVAVIIFGSNSLRLTKKK